VKGGVARGGIAGLLAVVLFVVPAQAQTRADYVAQADPICRSIIKPARKIDQPVNRAAKLFNAAQKQHKSKKVLGRLAKHFFHVVGRAYTRLGKLSNRTSDRVRAIPPPPEDAALIGQWLALQYEIGQDLFDAADAARHFDFSSLDGALKAADQDNNAANRLVAGFGFKYCAAPVKSGGPAL
jgi:hypothetical protein